jgi:aminobutyraldehyde dehydrogenase
MKPIIMPKEMKDKEAPKLRYGFTWANTHGVGTPEMPWTTMKGSGTGLDMSVYVLDAYTSIRHVMVAH